MVRNRTKIVEKLTEQVPATVEAHGGRAEEDIAVAIDGLFEKEFPAAEFDVGQTLVGRGEGTIGRFGGGGEPTLVDAAALAAEDVEVAGIELETSSGHEKGAGHPARGQADDSVAGGDRFADKS